MTGPTDIPLIAAHLSAALITQGKGLAGGVPAADAVKLYQEVLQALLQADKPGPSERMDELLESSAPGA